MRTSPARLPPRVAAAGEPRASRRLCATVDAVRRSDTGKGFYPSGRGPGPTGAVRASRFRPIRIADDFADVAPAFATRTDG